MVVCREITGVPTGREGIFAEKQNVPVRREIKSVRLFIRKGRVRMCRFAPRVNIFSRARICVGHGYVRLEFSNEFRRRLWPVPE